ncbi:MAG: MBL fold metallo-hydrolase [Planctomycetes bacterium]|nr:MBL fold metallo-hydrolase [Planctomycetota bacterium]
MRLQVLSSGSGGNSALVRAGETAVLVDAGLTVAGMEERLEAARIAPIQLDHVFVTHGHLDHARAAGAIARKARCTLHCAEAMMRNAAIRRSKNLAALSIDVAKSVRGKQGDDELVVTPVALPHDAAPTVAFKLEHAGRRAVILTDMGCPRSDVARALSGAHVLVLEFNHDVHLLESGPYPLALKRRILGNAGHLSNAQSREMLRGLASEHLHTLVLAHLSDTNNTRELALEAAHATLDELGLTSRVRVLVAEQDRIGESLEV